jgi:hypothetical protein
MTPIYQKPQRYCFGVEDEVFRIHRELRVRDNWFRRGEGYGRINGFEASRMI